MVEEIPNRESRDLWAALAEASHQFEISRHVFLLTVGGLFSLFMKLMKLSQTKGFQSNLRLASPVFPGAYGKCESLGSTLVLADQKHWE